MSFLDYRASWFLFSLFTVGLIYLILGKTPEPLSSLYTVLVFGFVWLIFAVDKLQEKEN